MTHLFGDSWACLNDQWLRPVQLAHGQSQALASGEINHALCHARKDGLPSFVVGDIALRATNTRGKYLLRYA